MLVSTGHLQCCKSAITWLRSCSCRNACAECFVDASHTGDMFYVVEEGEFTIYGDGETELAHIGPGSCFGELALLRAEVSIVPQRSAVRSSKHEIIVGRW